MTYNRWPAENINSPCYIQVVNNAWGFGGRQDRTAYIVVYMGKPQDPVVTYQEADREAQRLSDQHRAKAEETSLPWSIEPGGSIARCELNGLVARMWHAQCWHVEVTDAQSGEVVAYWEYLTRSSAVWNAESHLKERCRS